MPGTVSGVGPQRDIDILGDYWFASINDVPGLLVFDDGGVLKAIHDDADGESALSYHVGSVSSGYFFIEDGHFVELAEIRDRVSQAGVPLYEITVQLRVDGDLIQSEAYIAGNSYSDDRDYPPYDLVIPQSF